jgi:hypothetical protein
MIHINDPSSSIGFHLTSIILIKENASKLYINHKSIKLINQTIGINDNMIQQSPPLALMEIPTSMSTLIIGANK